MITGSCLPNSRLPSLSIPCALLVLDRPARPRLPGRARVAGCRSPPIDRLRP
ncbi:hypothetical protein SLNWT_2174 [Streptomyces albus]|uniref:Uncharacterized protein n=1 Tax=Streptomyces albus (strain ATCC 21838 / DSM 41398 / FERM P-419 / JCM 4703 / NBRC 107858) TaxID=1081613 RepID=A0A0B5ETG7_STRA4|nr:hypothetical protein SLNWT_2174 [Streptomyces albus]AOU76865.1 hypothetical protein SLNHY_2174 [Streptomyces albus]